MSPKRPLHLVALACSSLLPLAACGGSTGNAQIFITAESTIPQGIDGGEDPENIRDGWSVRYDKFLVALGNFRAGRNSAPGDRRTDPRVLILDLTKLPASGYVLTEFKDLAATRWNQVGYDLPNATPSAVRTDTATQADYDLMVRNGWSLYVEGRLSNPSGQSCRPTAPADCVAATEIRFRWGLRAGTAFDGCSPAQGEAGFAVPTGGTAQVKPTIHGDHWFFNNLTNGVEITDRYAQWIANCDLDRDGETTTGELASVQPGLVFPSSRYSLSGSIIPIDSAFDYLEAQARTIGDFQGDGECPVRTVLP
ncbi:MAG TPA: hypothetical protein VH877_00835 [Polyangia bacterium]|jgi:hypothetical protein|nr:hypothetical protein [Polyangia bacterium]